MNRRSPEGARRDRVEVLVTWPRVLAKPVGFLTLAIGLPVSELLILGVRPMWPLLIGGVALVAVGVPLLVFARRRRRTGDRAGVALRIDRTGVYLGGRAELLPWSEVHGIDIWTVLNTFDGDRWTSRIEAIVGPPPWRRRDLPAADAERVRAVVEHQAPHHVPVRVHVTETYQAPSF